jgi:hypothetical protein
MVIAKTAITSGVDSELKEPKQSRKNNKAQHLAGLIRLLWAITFLAYAAPTVLSNR